MKQVSKWPSRTEQLSILVGPDPEPGREAGRPVDSVGGGKLASQIKQKGEGGEEEAEAPSELPTETAECRDRRDAEAEFEDADAHHAVAIHSTDSYQHLTSTRPSTRKDKIEPWRPQQQPANFPTATKKLGDKIVGLTLKEAKELSDYLEDVHGIEPAAGGAVMMAGPAAAAAALRQPRPRRPNSTSCWKASATRRSA